MQTRTERTLDENRPRKSRFPKRLFCNRPSATYKPNNRNSNEYNLPLCIDFIDYEKAFDRVEHFAIFKALRKTYINKTCITVYKTFTAKLQQGSI